MNPRPDSENPQVLTEEDLALVVQQRCCECKRVSFVAARSEAFAAMICEDCTWIKAGKPFTCDECDAPIGISDYAGQPINQRTICQTCKTKEEQSTCKECNQLVGVGNRLHDCGGCTFARFCHRHAKQCKVCEYTYDYGCSFLKEAHAGVCHECRWAIYHAKDLALFLAGDYELL